MKKLNVFVLASSILVLTAFTWRTATTWKISDNYSIQFTGTEVDGIFKTLKGEVEFEPSKLSDANFSFTVDVNSINTGNGMKNKHAVSDKWFDAKKYPNIVFKSKSFSKSGNSYSVKGDMSIHGKTKEISVPFSFEGNKIEAKFTVNRLDYSVGTMEGMSKKVSNEIKLTVSIPLKK